MNDGRNSIYLKNTYSTLKTVVGTVWDTIIRNIGLYPQRTYKQWGHEL